jgi:pimeloyl-ACP methyl ester carboxylesterase
MEMLRTSTAVVHGVSCRVREAGPLSSSEAVVFLHGNPGPSDDWEFVAPDVGAYGRAILADMPGFGVSDRPRDFDYSIPGYTAFLAALLDQLGVREAHLVLHDFGAGWGLSWASQHLDRLKSLTLINCGALRGYKWHKYARIWQTPILGELFQLVSNAGAMQRALNAENPRPVPRAFVERVFRYADWGHRRAVLKLYRNTRDHEQQREAALSRLATRPVPTLVLWGEGDTYIPVSFAEQQREVFPQAEIHVLRACGHWPFVDDPEAVRALLLPFLRRQLQGSASACAD